jgi:hypothetical protein
MKHGSHIFFEGGTTGKRLMWNRDPELWQRWKDGRTGQPLVDANMRELAATGAACGSCTSHINDIPQYQHVPPL